MPPLSLLSAKTALALEASGWSGFLTKRITDTVISGKMSKIVEGARCKIKIWYLDYRWNILVTSILNMIIAGLTLTSYFLFEVNNVIIYIISVISVFMPIRMLVRFILSLLRTVIPNWYNIKRYGRIFLANIFNGYGLSGSIRDTIHIAFMDIYENNTNRFTRGLHTVFSKLKFIKSDNEISEEVQDEFYNLITGHTIRVIIYKTIAFMVYLSVFNFVLKPFVFTNLIKINILEIIVYPFTVALPTVIMIIRELLTGIKIIL